MFSTLILIFLLRGMRRECLDEPSSEDNIFGEEHYGEVGYARDACVALGRDLIRTLQLTEATQDCQNLALTRTSTCWPFQNCKKWQRNDKENEKANEIVLTRALRMVEHFNNHVSEYPIISKTTDQKFIWKSIDIAVKRLIISGAVNVNSDLIGEIIKLRSNYCQSYKPFTLREAFQMEDEEEEREGSGRVRNKDYSRQMNCEYEQTETSSEIEIEFLQDCSPNIDEQETFTSEDEQGVPLHESVFRGNWRKFTNLLNEGCDLTKKDKHGNTALHLAVMLGRKDYVDLLLKFDAPVRSRNVLGWSSMDEALSYRNRDVVTDMLIAYNKQFLNEMMEKRKQLLSELENIKDFYMELRWDFHSWLPIISYLLPSELCVIRKRGTSIRMDSTSRRQNMTLLFYGKASPNPTVYELNDKKKHYSKFDLQPDLNKMTREAVATKVEGMLGSIIPHATISRSCIAIERLPDKWLGRNKNVGRFKADYYAVKNMEVKFRARKEHLSEQQIEKNDALEVSLRGFIMETLMGNMASIIEWDDSTDKEDEVESVPPCEVTWEQYISSKPGLYPALARPLVIKERRIKVKTSIGMSKQLPLPVDSFARMLEVIAPFKHFDKFREFIQMKLPEGFPVKLEIPIMATVSARITFLEFKYCSESEEDPFPGIQFEIPENYEFKET